MFFFFNKSHKQYLWCQHSWELVEIQINECDGVGIFHIQPCFHLINWAPAVDVIFWSYINDNLRFESGTYSAFSFCLIRFSTVWSHMCWELMVSNVIHHSVGLGWEIMIWLSCQSLVFLFIFFWQYLEKTSQITCYWTFFWFIQQKNTFWHLFKNITRFVLVLTGHLVEVVSLWAFDVVCFLGGNDDKCSGSDKGRWAEWVMNCTYSIYSQTISKDQFSFKCHVHLIWSWVGLMKVRKRTWIVSNLMLWITFPFSLFCLLEFLDFVFSVLLLHWLFFLL